jgi:hypothetical protein
MPKHTPAVPVEVGTIERDRLDRLHGLAHLLDSAIRVPGTGFRFGLDPILGLIPGLGDAVAAAMSGVILLEAARLGVPRRVLLRMAANVIVEVVGGAVPLAGDLFDAAWKANQRNMRLLDEAVGYPVVPAKSRRGSRWLAAGLVLLILLVVAGLGWLVISLLRAAIAALG